VLYLRDSTGIRLVKVFIVVSLGLAILSGGENMSIYKLKFHCLRYIAPSFIALNFGTAYLLSRLLTKPQIRVAAAVDRRRAQ
jgi:hypothetical protein